MRGTTLAPAKKWWWLMAIGPPHSHTHTCTHKSVNNRKHTHAHTAINKHQHSHKLPQRLLCWCQNHIDKHPPLRTQKWRRVSLLLLWLLLLLIVVVVLLLMLLLVSRCECAQTHIHTHTRIHIINRLEVEILSREQSGGSRNSNNKREQNRTEQKNRNVCRWLP